MRVEGAPRRVNHAAVTVDDKVYSFGGYGTGEDYVTRGPIDIQVLDTVSLRWTPMRTESHPKDVPYQRYGHTVVAYGDCIYLWGGRDDNGACNVVHCYDTCTEMWSRPKVGGHVPWPRDGHSACVIGQRMYVFGGLEADRFSQDVHFLDLESMNWQYVHTNGQPPRWRGFHSASAIGDRMYVWGGRSDAHGPFHTRNEVYCDCLAYLDTVTASWVYPQVNGLIPMGRRSHSSFVHKGELYIFGGYNGLLATHFGSLHKYSPHTSQWSLVQTQRTGPCARRRQCCCMVGDRLFVFGGTSPATNDGNQQHVNGFYFSEFTLRDHSDMHVLDFSPSLKTLCILTVIQKGMDISDLPRDVQWDVRAMAANSTLP